MPTTPAATPHRPPASALGAGAARNDRTRRLRTWYLVHKWTSLVCTLFLLIVCLTGLPLVFSDEIDALLSDDAPFATVPADAPRVCLGTLAADALRRHPGEIVTSIYVQDDAPAVWVWLAPSWKSFANDEGSRHYVKFDAHTGHLVKASGAPGQQARSFMDVMLSLHTDLFAGLPGELFLGAMALCFVAALVSGVVLYAPFMRHLPFGTVRAERAPRLRWLDLHNLLGIATLAWMGVVGVTGAINELSAPLFGLWMRTDVTALLEPWQGLPPPAIDQLVSPQVAFDTVARALPGMRVTGVVYPGSDQGSAHHYVLWTRGTTALTSRLFSPVLVDARTGALTRVIGMPWYLRALEISRPLHFGDYGGLPLKGMWALLDLISIAVLGSGLYLWIARRNANGARLAQLARAHDAPARAPRGVA